MIQVAEMGEQKKIVGMIRGCIKIATCGKKHSRNAKTNTNNNELIKMVPVYTKVAYILGLRVSPFHRYTYDIQLFSTLFSPLNFLLSEV